MNSFWQKIYFGNSIQDWLISFAIIVTGFILLRIIRQIFFKRLKKWMEKTASSGDFILAGLETSVFPMLYVLVIYFALNFLTISEKLMHKISSVLGVVIMFFILRIITAAVRYFILAALRLKDANHTRVKQAGGMITIINFVIWILGFIFLLDNLGYNIGTLIAGLGIGGIAIALGAQAILGDIFSYFVIFFDRPFEIGDMISVDDQSGHIEYIGIKTTRVRALSGEQLIFSNKDLTNSRLHNFGRMEKRRVVLKFGVIYQTSTEKLKSIPEIIKSIIESQGEVEYSRGNFVAFASSSLDFEFIYYVLSPDYNIYINKHQNILLSIFEVFEKMKIEFAYPTQTLFIDREPVSGKPSDNY